LIITWVLIGAPATNDWRAAEGLIVLFRGRVLPGQPDNDGAVGERQCPFTVGLYGCVVAKDGAKVVQVPGFVSHRDHLPIAESGWQRDPWEQRGLFADTTGGIHCGGDHACHHGDGEPLKMHPIHANLPFTPLADISQQWQWRVEKPQELKPRRIPAALTPA
jgi:hypothetical protein